MKQNGFVIVSISICILLIFWELGAKYFNSQFILPDPISVFRDALVLFTNPSFLHNLIATFMRGIVAFFISLGISFILGFSSGLSRTFNIALIPIMSIIKSTPVVSFILIALLWFGSSQVPIFVSVLMTLPVMTESIQQGVKNIDKTLIDMTYVYKIPRWKRLVYVRLPSIMPFFLAGTGSSLGLTWKVVVAGEILSSPRYGLGSAMQAAKIQLETQRVFSLTAVAILLSILTEFIFNALIRFSKRHGFKES